MADQRPQAPILAIVTGHLTPYRIAFHKRLAAEIPELQLATLVTKYRTGPWINPSVPEIGTVLFDPTSPPGEDVSMVLDRGGRSLAQHLRHEWATARTLWAWLEQHRPAAVVCGGYDELPSLNALRWANKRGVPVFLWTDSNVHGDLATGARRAVKNVYVPRVCSRYTGILVCGTAGRRFFHRYGVQDDRLFVMPVEPDYAAIENMPPSRIAELAGSLGLDPARRRIVCCCRLIPVKRVDLVIDAFHAIAGERPDWDLVIVGKGESQPALEQRASHLLSHRIKFVGFQDTAAIAAIYRSSHALVLASDYEPWALVVNEAAAAGLAIIASDRVGAAYELVKNDVNGRMFPAGDLRALTQAMRDCTAEPANSRMRGASLAEIARWRAQADPVQGMRAALARAGLPLKAV